MNKEMTKRIPRNKRVGFAPKMFLTERDKQIVLAVYENRYLRRDQIQRLLFMGTTACNRRLMRLYQHGYLERFFVPVTFGAPPAVYHLDRRGSQTVALELRTEEGDINWKKRNSKVESLFLQHTLAVAEFRVSLELAVKKKGNSVLFWKGQGKSLNDRVSDRERRQRFLLVTPDAFFAVRSGEGKWKSYFFLEVDLGTETLSRFAGKILAYREYWKSGKYTQRYTFQHFRVLTVTESEKRKKNLIHTAHKVGAKNMFLFTTIARIGKQGLFAPIWFSPVSTSPINLLE